MHDKLQESSLHIEVWDRQLKKIASQKCKYHCLIGISGGFDSSMMLLWAVKHGLNPLVIHFDNGWNTDESMNNIRVLTESLDVDFIRLHTDRDEYDDLCKAFLWASVPDADIPNDMAMAAMMLRVAYKYGIKYVLNGHNFRTEGSSPISWSYMDARYVESVYKWHTGKELRHFPLLTFWEQIFYALTGITQVRPLYYMDAINEDYWRDLLKALGWQDYGAKHSENIYTDFIGSYYLPRKFNINKSLTYQSALIRSGKMLKTDYLEQPAYKISDDKIQMVIDRLGLKEKDLNRIMDLPHSDFSHFQTYHKTFRRYKWLLWILMRLGLIPYTFFRKYTA